MTPPTETDVARWIEECLRLGWIAEHWNDDANDHEYTLTDAGRRHLREVA